MSCNQHHTVLPETNGTWRATQLPDPVSLCYLKSSLAAVFVSEASAAGDSLEKVSWNRCHGDNSTCSTKRSTRWPAVTFLLLCLCLRAQTVFVCVHVHGHAPASSHVHIFLSMLGISSPRVCTRTPARISLLIQLMVHSNENEPPSH